MSHTYLTRVPSLLLTLVLGTPLAFGMEPAVQEPSGELESPEQEADEPPFQIPSTVEEALALEDSALKDVLESMPVEKIGALLTDWMVLIEIQQEAYEAASAASAESGEHAGAMKVGTDRDTLLGRADKMLARLVELEGSDEIAAARIAGIRNAEAAEDSSPTVPVNQETAQELDIEVLKALMRPLTLEQAIEQQQLWIDLLQKKCNAVRNVEIAALQSEDADEIADYNQKAVERRAERARLIRRVEIVIKAVEKKGGDVAEVRAYVNSVVITPPITGMRAAWVTWMAWLTNRDGGLALLKSLGMGLGVLLASWILAKFLGGLAGRAMKKVPKTSELLRGFVATSVTRVVILLGVLVALGQMGVSMAPWLAAIGAAGLVVGLALQGTLSNFASGIMIMIYRPFDVGDVIATAGPTGEVKGMTLVTTTVRTFDNQTVHIPNNMVWGDVITNITANATRRVDMVFGIGYDDDMRKAKQVLMEVISGHEKVLAQPEPNVQVHELADSSVNFIARPWVRTADYWDVYWDLTQAVKERFDSEGISIPFPQRDMHMIPAAGSEPGIWIQPSPAGEDKATDTTPTEQTV